MNQSSLIESQYISVVKSTLSILLMALFSLSSLNLIKAKHQSAESSPITFIINKGKCKCPQPDGSKGCCESDIKYLTLDQDYVPADLDQTFDLVSHISLIVYETLFEKCDEHQATQYLTYKPPIPDRDIPVLIQSFLI